MPAEEPSRCPMVLSSAASWVSPLKLRLHLHRGLSRPPTLQLSLCHTVQDLSVSLERFHQSLEHSVLHLSLLKTQYHGNYAARFCCQPRMELSPIGPWCQQLCALVLGEVLLATTFDSGSFKGILSLGPLLINGFALSQCGVIYGWDLAPESSFPM